MDFRRGDYLPLLRQEAILWDLYTRREEYDAPSHVRSQFYQPALNDHPRVSRFLLERRYSVEYPEGRPFAICLTHDVDDVTPPLSHLGRMAMERIRSRNLTGLWDLAGYAAGRGTRSPYRNFLEIRGLEEQYDAGSTFFFLATDQDILRFRYRVEDLTADLESLIGTGAEIGLHGGFASCGSLDAIRAEKGRLERVLGQDVTGYRNHFLRFRIPESWAYLEQAGFSYDSTLGYNHSVGFRNGMVHPFRPFNLRTGTAAGILEIPLVVMERAYINTRTPPSRAWDSLRAILEMGERCHGVVTVNWHNTSFAGMPDRTWERMYRKLLHYGKERGAWMAGGAEISRFWKETGGS